MYLDRKLEKNIYEYELILLPETFKAFKALKLRDYQLTLKRKSFSNSPASCLTTRQKLINSLL